MQRKANRMRNNRSRSENKIREKALFFIKILSDQADINQSASEKSFPQSANFFQTHSNGKNIFDRLVFCKNGAVSFHHTISEQ